jgi:alcohol dehydrogenase, propanol-preferring
VTIPFRELIFRDIKVSGSLTASVPQTEEMLEFAAKHNIRVKTNPYHGLKEIPKMWDDAHSGKMQGKGVVIIDESQV